MTPSQTQTSRRQSGKGRRTPIRVGVIGCGSVAQQMHLPHLKRLSSKVKLVGVCDASPSLAAKMRAKYGAEFATTDFRELLAQDLDAVVVAVSLPAEDIVIAALEAGCHVFVEKPMAWSPKAALRIEEAVKATRQFVMVGYMKRYDPAYLLGRDLIRKLGVPSLVLVHDLAGPNDPFITDVTEVERAKDLPKDVAQAGAALAKRRVQEAIGKKPDQLGLAYTLLLGLCSHDINLFRNLFGDPDDVLACSVRKDGLMITALLRYPDFDLVFESGLVLDIKRFDQRIEVSSQAESVKIAFPSPFITNAPTMVTRWRMNRKALVEEVFTASYEEAFFREMVEFAECVASGRAPETSAAEARRDTELMVELIKRAELR